MRCVCVGEVFACFVVESYFVPPSCDVVYWICSGFGSSNEDADDIVSVPRDLSFERGVMFSSVQPDDTLVVFFIVFCTEGDVKGLELVIYWGLHDGGLTG